MKKLYYNSEESEFYFVTKRAKTIIIQWATCKVPVGYNYEGNVVGYSVMSSNVKWKKDFVDGNGMVVNICGKNTNYCLKEYSDDYILIYPYQDGQPFALKPATVSDIKKQINFEYSPEINDYYYKLLKFIGD